MKAQPATTLLILIPEFSRDACLSAFQKNSIPTVPIVRRMSDGGATYSLLQNPDVTSGALSDLIIKLNEYITTGAFGMFAIQIVFVINFFYSIRHGEKVEGDNPVESTTLEWQAPTPPPHGNFTTTPKVYGDPYVYSYPETDTDFIPQTEKNRPEAA